MQVALVTLVVVACALHVVWAVLLPARWRQPWSQALRRRLGLGPGRIGGGCEGCGGGCDAGAVGQATATEGQPKAAEKPIRRQPRRRG
ncbi:MAG: hypothetical protein J0L57_16280 [Burkholderiales bacterium]|nr:hypothetical protein [Burkholderiales bacterium]